MNENIILLPELKTHPAVFAVKNNYQIMVPVKSDLLFWVVVNGEKYFDHSNGIIRSSTRIHRVTIPMENLDKAGEYTICYKRIIDRKPYFPETHEECCCNYKFKPVNPTGKINIYHLSDTHGAYDIPASTGQFFGDELDLLILNGDIIDHSGSVENFDLIYKLCEHITHGGIPCVFSRGNHDTRGFYAENICDYTPTENGNSYFTFRLGRLWGMVFDCGEDKNDNHAEYGNTICCHAFRKEETKYLEAIISDAQNEYLADGVEYRIIVSHVPFSLVLDKPFNIEQDTYNHWLKMLNKNVKPNIMLCGHLHELGISPVGGKYDTLGQPCNVVVGSVGVKDGNGKMIDFYGCGVTLNNKNITVLFTDCDGNVMESTSFDVK